MTCLSFSHKTLPCILKYSSIEIELRVHWSTVELVSFHSISKGVSGECGRRGGYFECANIEEEVIEEIYKMASVAICSPVAGQIGVDLLVKPPVEGDESYEQYIQETQGTHETMKFRSEKLAEAFNKLEGMTCNKAEVCSIRSFIAGAHS